MKDRYVGPKIIERIKRDQEHIGVEKILKSVMQITQFGEEIK